MLDQILSEHGSEMITAITERSDLDTGEAQKLLPPALDGIGSALSSGNLDIGSLLGGGGGASALLEQLDIGALAGAAGIEEGRARGALESLVPVVLSILGKEGGGGALGSLLGAVGGESGAGGALGAIGGIAGKLFGK